MILVQLGLIQTCCDIMPKFRKKVEDCSHIYVVLGDSGMKMASRQRDVGLKCKDCGTVWDIKLFHGQKRAYIKVRQPEKKAE